MDIKAIVERIELRIGQLKASDPNVSARSISLAAGLSGDGIRNLQRAAAKPLREKGGATGETIASLARALNVSLDWLMNGVGSSDDPWSEPSGFAESARQFVHKSGDPESDAVLTAAKLFGQRPGVDVWIVSDDSMLLEGFRQGDHILVDSRAAHRVAEGQIVLAQVYDDDTGTARTILRRFDPPFLMPASRDVATKPDMLDAARIVGVVTARWNAVVLPH